MVQVKQHEASVLIIDDDSGSREALAELLVDEGCGVATPAAAADHPARFDDAGNRRLGLPGRAEARAT